jgi:hypothetical protein
MFIIHVQLLAWIFKVRAMLTGKYINDDENKEWCLLGCYAVWLL